jgi:hypothetical protein
MGIPADWFLRQGYLQAARAAHHRLQRHLAPVVLPSSWSVEHLLAFIDMETERIHRGIIKVDTLTSNLSRITSVQRALYTGDEDWGATVRQHHRVVNRLKAISEVRILAPCPTEHNYAVSLTELQGFVGQLNIKHWDNKVLGAVSTSLFWGLGRTFELLLADKWDPLPIGALIAPP